LTKAARVLTIQPDAGCTATKPQAKGIKIMARKRPYNGRSLSELATLPDQAKITRSEYRAWHNISESTYWRKYKSGDISAVDANGRHEMGQTRSDFQSNVA
jgi:hypothetical protein